MREDIDIDAIKAQLLARAKEIAEAAEAAEESLRPVELDQGRMGRLSRMGDLQEHEMALAVHRREQAELKPLAVHRREQAELKRIEGALERLAEDEYGDCVSCGAEIGAKRLNADPSVATCIDCASRAHP